MSRLLNITEVLSVTTLSRASLYRSIKSGIFPPPVKIGLRRVAWRYTDIQPLLERGINS